METKFTKLLIFLLISIVPSAFLLVKAEEPFQTSYNINYEFDAKGETSVTHDITIENKQNDVIASNYSLIVRQLNLFNIEAYDSKNKLETEVTQDKELTTIKVDFNKEVIGEGRKNNFKIKFKTKDIANKIGEVWNINLPKIQIPENSQDYNVSITVPNSFGPEIFISPVPNESTEEKLIKTYRFTKDVLLNKGISASFGKFQVINFQLKYKLFNSSNFHSYEEIALPPDIQGKQQISYGSLNPKPWELKTDYDGNTIAVYKLDPKKDLNIEFTGSAKVVGKQINIAHGGEIKDIPRDLLGKYTRSQKYWETTDKKIQEIAKSIFNPESNVSENAKFAYDYVVKNLNYDGDLEKKSFIQRNGAKTALSTEGKWGCMEFTDSFIAITRAMGIPARELDGYAFSNENISTPLSINLKGGDVLHSWAEFYDPNFGWVAIDPTWGATSGLDYFTKLDTSHLAFSIKGINSELPLPAGLYRTEESNEKLISVDFAQNQDESLFKENLSLYKTSGLNVFKLLAGKRPYILSNSGKTAVYDVEKEVKVLLPGQKTLIYMPKDVDKIYYVDFNSNEVTKEIEISGEMNSDTNVFLVILAIVIVVVAVLVYFKKLPIIPRRV